MAVICNEFLSASFYKDSGGLTKWKLPSLRSLWALHCEGLAEKLRISVVIQVYLKVYLKLVSVVLYCLALSNWDDELGKCCVWLVFLQTVQDDHSSRKKHFPLYVSISGNAESVQRCSLFIIEK